MSPSPFLLATITRTAIRRCRQVPGKLPLSLARPLTAAPAVSHQREHTSETRLMRLPLDRRLWRERETGALTMCSPPISPAAPSRRFLITKSFRPLLWAPLNSLAPARAQTCPSTVLRVHLCTGRQIHTCAWTLVCTSPQYVHQQQNASVHKRVPDVHIHISSLTEGLL